MKADLAMVTMRPTEQELTTVADIIEANCVGDIKPNIIINVYKNRGGTYGQVRIFAMQNLGNMRFTDLFVTDWDYKQIDPKVLPKLHLKSPNLLKQQEQERVTEEEIGMKNVHIITDEDIKDIKDIEVAEVTINPDTGEIVEEEEEVVKISRGGRRRKSKAE
jgi:hypothetical protein